MACNRGIIGKNSVITHGAIMGVIFLAWLKYAYKANVDRAVQFADRICDIDINRADPERAIIEAIRKLELFLKAMRMPTTLQELGIHDKTPFTKIAENCVRPMQSGTIGNFARLSPQDIITMLDGAY